MLTTSLLEGDLGGRGTIFLGPDDLSSDMESRPMERPLSEQVILY